MKSKQVQLVNHLLEDAIAKRRVPGAAIYIGRKDITLYRKAFGSQSWLPKRKPMKIDTIFDLASLTKPVACATSILSLAGQGKITIETPVSHYIPAFGVKGKKRITIRQLLLHTGGMAPTNPLAEYSLGREHSLSRAYNAPVVHAPGSCFCYSDLGYIVLGELVYAVSGRRLEVFAREEIFMPLGMTNTIFNPSLELRQRCATTAMRDDKWLCGMVHDPRAAALGGVAGHAGLFSTVDDLARFCRLILRKGSHGGRRILSEKVLVGMTSSHNVPRFLMWA